MRYCARMNHNDSHVLNKRIRLKQPEDGFRTGLDAVLLAAACPARSGESLLDLGCGVGAAGLCVLARIKGASLSGIDIQSDHIELARENAQINSFEASFQEGDIKDFSILPSPRKRGSSAYASQDPRFRGEDRMALFDHIICNPPYQDAGEHTASPSPAKATAHTHPDDTTLLDWIKAAHRNVKPAGSLTMIHRADKTDKILQAMENRFGAVEIIPLWPKAGAPAKRVIIRALRDRKTPATLHPGLVLHMDNGDYTPAAESILRDAQPIV